jgi:RNA polymerase sigma-70 factor (ECF subfamily)
MKNEKRRPMGVFFIFRFSFRFSSPYNIETSRKQLHTLEVVAATDVRELFGTLLTSPASNPMSSLSRAQDDFDFTAENRGTGSRESELFRRAQGGDRSAYGQLVQHFQDRLYNTILRIVGEPEEARELTQETFTKALISLESFRGDASPYTWLFRIGVNLAISQLRKVQRRRTFSLDAPSKNGRSDDDQASSLLDRIAESKGEAPDEALLRQERQQKVIEALGRLDAEYRAVLVMRDIEGFDYQQMADVLGLNLGTLKSRLFRARLALRDELKEYLK